MQKWLTMILCKSCDRDICETVYEHRWGWETFPRSYHWYAIKEGTKFLASDSNLECFLLHQGYFLINHTPCPSSNFFLIIEKFWFIKLLTRSSVPVPTLKLITDFTFQSEPLSPSGHSWPFISLSVRRFTNFIQLGNPFLLVHVPPSIHCSLFWI